MFPVCCQTYGYLPNHMVIELHYLVTEARVLPKVVRQRRGRDSNQ